MLEESAGYDVVIADEIELLINIVREKTANGLWKPQGGVASTVDSGCETKFYQAIVRSTLASAATEE